MAPVVDGASMIEHGGDNTTIFGDSKRSLIVDTTMPSVCGRYGRRHHCRMALVDSRESRASWRWRTVALISGAKRDVLLDDEAMSKMRSLVIVSWLGAVAITPAQVDAQVAASQPSAARPRLATAVFSGGCYWTMEAIFEHVRGVTDVVSGITGREVAAELYARNPTGSSGPAEAVRVTFDMSRVSYDELLRVFFVAAHDPTQINRQGPDVGQRYRSVVWVRDDRQRRSAADYIRRLQPAGSGRPAIATQIAGVGEFRPVVESEQDFVFKYPAHPYVMAWDVPKLEKFRRGMPELYVDRASQ